MNESRIRIMLAAFVAVNVVALSSYIEPDHQLIYNPSTSAPRGFYGVRPARAPLRVGDYALARLPDDVAVLADARGYLPRTVPILKRVGATAGSTVCRNGRLLTVDGVAAAAVPARDGAGRPLPVWRGCRRVGQGEVLLLSPRAGSFDGRFYGPIPATLVIGEARPLWTW